MNVIFDGNYLLHKTFSVFQTYYKDMSVEQIFANKARRDIFYRKLIIDFCFALNKIEGIEKVIFCFDTTSWRYQIYPDYKMKATQREENEAQIEAGYEVESKDALFIFLDWFIERLSTKGFITDRVEGFEGDDLIYYWSKYLEGKGKDVVIISGDGDMKQLITPKVSLFFNNSKRLNWFYDKELKKLSAKIDTASIALNPTDSKYELIKKIFLGDKGDNIDGILKGFGPAGFDKLWEQRLYDLEIFEPTTLMAQSLTMEFLLFGKIEKEQAPKMQDAILSNMRLIWLNEKFHPKEIREKMTDKYLNQKYNSYNYHKPFSLEYFLNLPIK